MNTNDDRYGRPAAVVQAEHGGVAWRSVVHAQLSANVDHGDWYSITAEMVDTLRSLASLATVFAQQIAHYGESKALRDDAGMDPAERLAAASARAAELRIELDRTERVANAFWSEISHIAVEEWS